MEVTLLHISDMLVIFHLKVPRIQYLDGIHIARDDGFFLVSYMRFLTAHVEILYKILSQSYCSWAVILDTLQAQDEMNLVLKKKKPTDSD
jgi:hypothetical protein